MPCTRPLKAYRAPGGGVAFNSVEGYSDRPLELPCGQCFDCRLQRSKTWALRCVHEAAMHDRNCFVTLTYDQVNVPKDGSLNVSDWQLFAKRVRKTVGSFRFFMCGEYGERSSRPHYHACMFGLDFKSDAISVKGDLYTSPTLQDRWGLGFVTVGSLTWQSAAYVARYVMKKATGPLAEERYTRFDSDTGECWTVRPEFVSMSRRPGVGATWFDRFHGDVYPSDEVIHRGKRFRPPRYYDDLLSQKPSGELLLEQLKSKRRRLAAQREEDLTPERLRAREEVSAANVKRLKRDDF